MVSEQTTPRVSDHRNEAKSEKPRTERPENWRKNAKKEGMKAALMYQ
jgi:hypothetical protein